MLEREKETQDSEEFLEKKRVEEEERKKQSHDMVAESIRRELLESEHCSFPKRCFIPCSFFTEEKEKETPDVDDTDGLDPETEFEAWRLRELNRIKQDKEEQTRREQEREEIERRRALPEEQRLKEDMEHAKKTREKPKGQQKFLQKYWHKGAFHQVGNLAISLQINQVDNRKRTMKCLRSTITRKLRSLRSMCHYCPKLCKFETLESAAAQSIHIY